MLKGEVMAKERHKTKFIVGDRVVLINLGPFTGIKGQVWEIKGLIGEKYVIKMDGTGKLTAPIKPRFLTRDKRNN